MVINEEPLENLRCILEADMPVGESTNHNRSVTGESYVTLTSGGVKPEGQFIPRWHQDKESAIKAYIDELHKYRDSVGGGTLYWRRPPTMQRRENGVFSVSSRLLISPVVVLEKACLTF